MNKMEPLTNLYEFDSEQKEFLLYFTKYEDELEKGRTNKRRKKAEQIGMTLEEYDKTPRRRKILIYTNVSKPIKGINFTYTEGILKSFKLSNKNCLSIDEIVYIGKENKFWEHKIYNNDTYKLCKCVRYAARKLVLKKVLEKRNYYNLCIYIRNN